MKKKIKGIIFDLGGVLVEDFSGAFFENTAKELGVSVARIRRAIRKEEILLQKGKETNLQFWHRICQRLMVQCPSNRVLSSLWLKPYQENAKVNRRVLALVNRLRQNYPLGIISNTVKEHTLINKKRGLFRYFDAVLLSHDIGLRKPQREIFLLASKRMHVSHKNILFIDDELRWVKAARKAGLQSVLFRSAEQLEKRLMQLVPEGT